MKSVLGLVAVALTAGLFALPVGGTPLELQLFDNDGSGNWLPVTIEDNGPLDADPLAGSIAYSGAVGSLAGNFAGIASMNNGTPLLSLSGTFTNGATGSHDLIAYLCYEGYGPMDVDASTFTVRDQFSITTTGMLNFAHSSWDGSAFPFSWENLTIGSMMSCQSAYGGTYYDGLMEGYSAEPIYSLSQLTSIATDGNTTLSFLNTSTVVPDLSSLIGLVALSLMGLVFFRRIVGRS